MPGIRSKMIAAAVITMISLAMLVVASVAWFTISTNPEVSGMEVTIATTERLLVSETGNEDTWEETLDLSENFKYYAPLKPVSTVDGLNWFLPEYNYDGSLVDVNDFELDDELKYANSLIYKEDGGNMVKLTGTDLQSSSSDGYYVYGDFYLKTEDEEADVYISFPNPYAQENTELNSTDGTYVLPAYEIAETTEDTEDTEDTENTGGGTLLSALAAGTEENGTDGNNTEGGTEGTGTETGGTGTEGAGIGTVNTDTGVTYTISDISQGAQNAVRVGLLINPDYTAYTESKTADVRAVADYDENLFYIYEPNADKRTDAAKPVSTAEDDTNRYILSYDYAETDYKDGYYYETLPIKKTNEEDTKKGDEVKYKYIQTRIDPSSLIIQNACEWDEDSLKNSMISAYKAAKESGGSWQTAKWWSSFDVKYPYGSFLNSNSVYNGVKYNGTFYSGLMTGNSGTDDEGTGSGVQVLFPYEETVQVARTDEDGTEVKDEDGETIYDSITVTKYDSSPYEASPAYASSQNLITLKKDKPVRVRLFIWIEGQDIDCWNDIAAGGFVVNLELAANTVATDVPGAPTVKVMSEGVELENNQLVNTTVYFQVGSDGTVPIGHYEYSTDYATLSDKSAATWQVYNAVSTRYSATGDYTLSFRSVSANGVVNNNEDDIVTVNFSILQSDKPVITPNYPEVTDTNGNKITFPINGWYPKGTTLSATVNDPNNEFTLQYKAPGTTEWVDYTDNTPITALDGENTYSFRTISNDGKFTYPEQSVTLKVDTTGPSFTMSAVTYVNDTKTEVAYNSGDEGGKYVRFTFTLGDGAKRSGLTYSYYYSTDGGTTKTLIKENPGDEYTKEIWYSGTYTFYLVSDAGGSAESQEWVVKINADTTDTTA